MSNESGSDILRERILELQYFVWMYQFHRLASLLDCQEGWEESHHSCVELQHFIYLFILSRFPNNYNTCILITLTILLNITNRFSCWQKPFNSIFLVEKIELLHSLTLPQFDIFQFSKVNYKQRRQINKNKTMCL